VIKVVAAIHAGQVNVRYPQPCGPIEYLDDSTVDE
jgi:hypothetical protein